MFFVQIMSDNNKKNESTKLKRKNGSTRWWKNRCLRKIKYSLIVISRIVLKTFFNGYKTYNYKIKTCFLARAFGTSGLKKLVLII